jgi:hypothetical protein
VAIAAAGGAKGNEGAGHMNEREVMRSNRLPTDAQRAEVVVPAIGAFDDPAARATACAADQRRLAAPTDMGSNAALSCLGLADRIVVALIEAEMTWTTRSAWRSQFDRVEHVADHAHVVDVGGGQGDSNRDAAAIAKDMAFGAELAAIGGIGTGEVPPFGALTLALSREHQVQSIPRSAS